jgi:hypothetical protein
MIFSDIKTMNPSFILVNHEKLINRHPVLSLVSSSCKKKTAFGIFNKRKFRHFSKYLKKEQE